VNNMKTFLRTISLKILVVIILLSSSILAQNRNSKYTFGSEVDLFPFISGGYYGSVFTGYENMRIRFVYAKSDIPEFILPDGFDKNTMKVCALLADYFINSENRINKWWVGIGFEQWQNAAHNKNDNKEGEFTTYIATAGFGYVFYLTDNVYLNPWSALHLRVAGEKEVIIGDSVYKNSLLLPELSLKIGVIF